MSIITVDQPAAALEKANVVRLAMSEVRLELAAGVIALAEAIEDPRSGSLTAFRLLTSIRRVGPHAARRVLMLAGVPEQKRIRDLTPRQRAALVDELALRVRHDAL